MENAGTEGDVQSVETRAAKEATEKVPNDQSATTYALQGKNHPRE